jgi:hypothetical protein
VERISTLTCKTLLHTSKHCRPLTKTSTSDTNLMMKKG